MLVGSTVDGNSYNHCEFVYKGSNTKKEVYEVFGWGQVNKVIKSQANFSIQGKLLQDTFNSNYNYSALYRKKVK